MPASWFQRVADGGQRLLAELLPHTCLVCGDPGHEGLDLCQACLAVLPWSGRACPRCALPMAIDAPLVCEACQRTPPPQAASWASLLYLPPVDQLLRRYKFQQDLAAGRLLAQLMQRAPPPWCCPPLLPVPLHARRLRARGYNQAAELCRLLRQPCWHGLQRQRATAPQSERSAAERRANLSGAFALRSAPPPRLTVVDDVMTTGSTVGEIARYLRQNGVDEVRVWVCARVPGSPGRGV